MSTSPLVVEVEARLIIPEAKNAFRAAMNPGDVFVIETEHAITRDQHAALSGYVQGILPDGVKVMILSGCTCKVVTPQSA